MTAHKLHDMLAKREISCTDITKSVLSRIEQVGSKTNSYIRVEKEKMIKEAGKVDEYIKKGGAIKDFTGINSPYEEPTNAQIVIKDRTIEQSVEQILDYLEGRY